MNEMNKNNLKTQLANWFGRKTTNSAVRRVGELPLAIGSDIGVQRKENQDRVAVLRMELGSRHSFTVAALCDGMGGMIDGTVCATQAMAVFFEACIRYRELPPATRLNRAAQDANRAVYTLHQGGGGATLSAVLFDSKSNAIGINVGDSRIYAYQDNIFEQLTVDDTLLGLLPNKKDGFKHRNELLQYVGMGEGLEPHIILIPESSESIFLTSDGVHFINKQTMQMVIQASSDSAIAVRRLIEVAKWCGGHDNASVIAFRPLPAPPALLHEPGIIQVWDPFGELQIISAETINERAEINTSLIKKPAVQKAADGILHPTKLLRPRKQTKKKATEKVPQIDDKETLQRPQLNIYFNGDAGKDGRHD